MKTASIIGGIAGLLVVLVAVIGRFHGAPTVTLMGYKFDASSVLLAGNTVLVTAAWMGMLSLLDTKKSSSAPS